MQANTETICPVCEGTGEGFDEFENCNLCHGTGSNLNDGQYIAKITEELFDAWCDSNFDE